ncbi:hypothetical protein [Planctomicrobium sp. SH527]|uniref:hypothetical protein n=1 Tax=Planctomicrobium sp. SH527 TaxID=3448123 RepID=UPI003F5CA65B
MFHTTTVKYFLSAVCAVSLLVTPSLLVAQQQTFNAAGKARARMQQSHKQTGAIGEGYRPWTAWSYQNSARVNSQVLNAYGQNCQQVLPETAREHLGQVRKDLASTKSEIAKIGADVAKEAGIKEDVDALEKHLTECEQICNSIETSIGQTDVETKHFCAHCTALEAKIRSVEKEHLELLKNIGVELPSSDK